MANEATARKAPEAAPTTAVATPAFPTARYIPEGTKEAYEVDWNRVPASSVKYALEVVLSKIIGNSSSNVAALTKSQMAGAALGEYVRTAKGDHSARDAAEKEWYGANKVAVDEVISKKQVEARQAALAAILDGTIAEKARSSSADPLSIWVDTVLTNAVRNHAAKTGQAIPQGAEMTKAKKAVLAQYGEPAVRAKAQTLLDASSL